jgi:hypothetical protein
MTIRKQEFYEGAALYIMAGTGKVAVSGMIRHSFLFDNRRWVLVRYKSWPDAYSCDVAAVQKQRTPRLEVAAFPVTAGNA